MRHTQLGLFLLALGCSWTTYLAAAATYCLLAVRPLSYGVTVVVQFAGMFINRLLPAGIGAIGVNYSYLRRQRHTAPEAAAIVALNNVLGTVGNLILLALGLLLFRHNLPPLHHLQLGHTLAWGSAAVIIAIFISSSQSRWRQKVVGAIRAFGLQISLYWRRPLRLSAALASSCLLTCSNVLTLWLCLRSVQAPTSLLLVLLALSFGVLVGAAAPTPGGIGGVEAGITGALVVYHVPAGTALAGVLLFRVLTYWLALVLGAAAFVVVRRQHWLNLKY